MFTMTMMNAQMETEPCKNTVKAGLAANRGAMNVSGSASTAAP